MSLVGVIADFASGTYTVTRAGAQTITDGMVTEAAGSTFDVVASIQPARGRALELLPPEARHVSAEYIALCLSEVRVDDVVSYKNQDWRVSNSKHWEEWGEEHWVVSMVKMQVNP